VLHRTRSKTQALRDSQIKSPEVESATRPIRSAAKSREAQAGTAQKRPPVLASQRGSQPPGSSRKSAQPHPQSSKGKDQSTQTDLPEKSAELRTSNKRDQFTQTTRVEQSNGLSPRARPLIALEDVIISFHCFFLIPQPILTRR